VEWPSVHFGEHRVSRAITAFADRASIEAGRSIVRVAFMAFEQLTADLGWHMRCSGICTVDGALVSILPPCVEHELLGG